MGHRWRLMRDGAYHATGVEHRRKVVAVDAVTRWWPLLLLALLGAAYGLAQVPPAWWRTAGVAAGAAAALWVLWRLGLKRR